MILARIRLYEAPEEANELFAQVVAEAEGDRETLAVAHEGFASCSFPRADGLLTSQRLWQARSSATGSLHSQAGLLPVGLCAACARL